MKQPTTNILDSYQHRFNAIYPHYLPTNSTHIGEVYNALHYSFSAGGKRIRPALVYALADSLHISLEKVDAAAVAVECIHTYSLIHDDLPDMDNDDLRRGKPACHKQFDPATAILAGDALNTLAFEILAKQQNLSDKQCLIQIQQLTQGAGINAMIAGQDTDINCENSHTTIDLEMLSRLHINKTAKLIEASLLMSYSASDNINAEKSSLLSMAAIDLGLFYQIQDDILDVTQTSEQLGKPAASDINNGKTTYVSLLGIEEAKKMAKTKADKIITALENFFAPEIDYRKTALAPIIESIIKRKN